MVRMDTSTPSAQGRSPRLLHNPTTQTQLPLSLPRFPTIAVRGHGFARALGPPAAAPARVRPTRPVGPAPVGQADQRTFCCEAEARHVRGGGDQPGSRHCPPGDGTPQAKSCLGPAGGAQAVRGDLPALWPRGPSPPAPDRQRRRRRYQGRNGVDDRHPLVIVERRLDPGPRVLAVLPGRLPVGPLPGACLCLAARQQWRYLRAGMPARPRGRAARRPNGEGTCPSTGPHPAPS
jgi:hypothetical protein